MKKYLYIETGDDGCGDLYVSSHYKEIARTFDGEILTIVEKSKTHLRIIKKSGVKIIDSQEYTPWFSPVGCPIKWKMPPVPKAFGLTKQYRG